MFGFDKITLYLWDIIKTTNQMDTLKRQNLEKLAKYLLGYKSIDGVEFTMITFARNTVGSTYDIDTMTKCGTAGCAIGHGPYAGIEKFKDENWHTYSDRCFVTETGARINKVWEWCFASEWVLVDNTPHGAGMRIMYLLQFGVPTWFEEACDMADEDGEILDYMVENYHNALKAVNPE